MPGTTKSYVRDGQAYFTHTGVYNEVTQAARNAVNNDASSAAKQKKLASKSKKSAAAQTLRNAWKELGW